MLTAESTKPSKFNSNDSHGCPACGIMKKSGKHSCCARGGAWFKNCGDTDDSKFDYTWTQGIKACQGFTTSVTAKTPLLQGTRDSAYPLQTTRAGNGSHQQTANIDYADSMSNVGRTDSEDRGGIAKNRLYFYVLLIFSHLQV